MFTQLKYSRAVFVFVAGFVGKHSNACQREMKMKIYASLTQHVEMKGQTTV
jgi:hypothetical protein